MNTVQFSVIATGETIQRNYDSNGNFIEKVIACKPITQANTVTLSPSEARARAQWQERKMQAFMDYRAKCAKPIRYGKKALQAIDYLLGDKYRDNRTSQEKQDAREWETLCKTGTYADRMAYLDTQREKLVKAILGDKETVEAIRNWLASPCNVDAKCERATYADMQREVMA